MMRWLLDQGLPRTTADLLRSRGMEAIHVGEIGMASAKDVEIIRLADSLAEGCAVTATTIKARIRKLPIKS